MYRSLTARPSRARRGRGGFTLLEVLIATTLMLMMMVLVASIFALMSDAVEGARAMIETSDRLRACRSRLQTDLAGVITPVAPPFRPEDGKGYFEYIEGPTGPCMATEFAGMAPDVVLNRIQTEGVGLDTTVGDLDDVLLFTTRAKEDTSFHGKFCPLGVAPPTTDIVQSQVAEVAWFLRGTTLYRRQLLVIPSIRTRPEPNAASPSLVMHNPWDPTLSFYKFNDLSVHQIYGIDPTRDPKAIGQPTLVANSLSDLTNRQYRFAHQPYQYPYESRFWGRLGLPTLAECSSEAQVFPFPFLQDLNQPFVATIPPAATAAPVLIYPRLVPSGKQNIQFRATQGPFPYQVLNVDDNGALRFDAWQNPQPWCVIDHGMSPEEAYSIANRNTGAISTSADQGVPLTSAYSAVSVPPGYESAERISEDVILTNVIGFDVKIFDPGAPVLQDKNTGDVFLPEDAGYPERLKHFADSPNQDFVIVRFGDYVDLNYMCLLGPGSALRYLQYAANNGHPMPQFHLGGDPRSQLVGTAPYDKDFGDATDWPDFEDLQAAVYDTWSTYYEHDGFDQNGNALVDEGANGLDDNNDGRVDDFAELESHPPYPYPATAVRVSLRVFEPDTQQVRVVTVYQEFLPQ